MTMPYNHTSRDAQQPSTLNFFSKLYLLQKIVPLSLQDS